MPRAQHLFQNAAEQLGGERLMALLETEPPSDCAVAWDPDHPRRDVLDAPRGQLSPRQGQPLHFTRQHTPPAVYPSSLGSYSSGTGANTVNMDALHLVHSVGDMYIQLTAEQRTTMQAALQAAAILTTHAGPEAAIRRLGQ